MAEEFERAIAPIKGCLLRLLQSQLTDEPYDIGPLLENNKATDSIYETPPPGPPDLSLLPLPTPSMTSSDLLALLGAYDPYLTNLKTPLHPHLNPPIIDTNPLTSTFTVLPPLYKIFLRTWFSPPGFATYRTYFNWPVCRRPPPHYLTHTPREAALFKIHVAAMQTMFATDAITLENYFFLAAASPDDAVSTRFFQIVVVFERILTTWIVLSRGAAKSIPHLDPHVPRRGFEPEVWDAMGGLEREFFVCVAVKLAVESCERNGFVMSQWEEMRRIEGLVKTRRDRTLLALVDQEIENIAERMMRGSGSGEEVEVEVGVEGEAVDEVVGVEVGVEGEAADEVVGMLGGRTRSKSLDELEKLKRVLYAEQDQEAQLRLVKIGKRIRNSLLAEEEDGIVRRPLLMSVPVDSDQGSSGSSCGAFEEELQDLIDAVVGADLEDEEEEEEEDFAGSVGSVGSSGCWE